ncbi:MAG: hypothetical protein HYX61_04570 [Gammaproteobacteria bacterium]|nr:hypothetical protein [Gammaproteobacteria bacterium]
MARLNPTVIIRLGWLEGISLAVVFVWDTLSGAGCSWLAIGAASAFVRLTTSPVAVFSLLKNPDPLL